MKAPNEVIWVVTGTEPGSIERVLFRWAFSRSEYAYHVEQSARKDVPTLEWRTHWCDYVPHMGSMRDAVKQIAELKQEQEGVK